MQALDSANEVRIARAELKKGVKTYELDAVELLGGVSLGGDVDALVARAKFNKVPVVDFLQWIPQVGDVKARQIVSQIKIREGLCIEHLHPNRRRDLTNILRNDLARYTTYRGKRGRIGTLAAISIAA